MMGFARPNLSYTGHNLLPSQLRKIDLLVDVERAVHRGERIFEAGRAIEQYRALVAADAPVGEALLISRIGGAPFGANQEAFVPRDLVYGVGDGFVRHRNGEAIAFAHGPQDQEIPDRLRNPDAAGDGVGILEARRMLHAGLERPHHRGAAGGLHGDHAGTFGADEADRFTFRKGLPHADQPGAAAGRIEDRVGQLPAQLLGELQPHGLLALDAIGLLEGRDVEPAYPLLSGADDLAAVVDQAIDPIDRRALQRDLADVHLRRVVRTEDRGLDAGAGGVGGKRCARIAVGRHRHVLDAEGLGHGNRHHEAAGLERSGRQPSFVVDQKLGAAEPGREPRQPDNRRHGLAEADNVLGAADRQELTVAPQVGRPLRQCLLAQRFGDSGKIVAHQQRLAGARQVVHLVRGVALARIGAFQMGHEGRPLGRQVVLEMQVVISPNCATFAGLYFRRSPTMTRTTTFAASLAAMILGCSATASAQAAPTFEKKNYNYSEWAKGRFSEAVTVSFSGPAKMIFLAGVGAEDESGKPGDIRHKDDFVAQCRYAYDKIKRALEKNGAGFGDIVKIVSYVTDMRFQADYGRCRSEIFGATPPPAHTLLNIVQLAWPGMMVEVDVTAMVPLK